MSAELVKAVLALDVDATTAYKLVPRLPDYLADTERLWTFVDTWRMR